MPNDTPFEDAPDAPDWPSLPATSLGAALERLVGYFGNATATAYSAQRLKSGEDITHLSECPEILALSGLSAHIVRDVTPDALSFPCCLALRDGTYLPILETRNGAFITGDPGVSGSLVMVDPRALEGMFTGEALFASVSLADMERRYLPATKQEHWFWGRLWTQKTVFRDIALASLIANFLAVGVSLFVLQVYDRIIPHQSLVTLWVLVAGVGLAIVLEAALRIARAHLLDAAGRKLEVDLAGFLFERFLGARLSQLKMSPGTSVASLREFGSIREFFTAASIGSVADIPFTVIFLLLIYAIAGNIVFIIIAAMAAIILPSLFVKSKMARLSAEALGATAAGNKTLIETAYGRESIKSHEAEDLFQRRWDDVTVLGATKTTSQRALAAGLTFSAQSIQQVAYIMAVVAGVYMIFAGEFTAGAIIAIGILSTRTLSPITQLAGILARWQQVKASLDGLDLIAHSPQERPRTRHFARYQIPRGEISIKTLSFRYHEDAAPCLAIEELRVRPGEKIAILGENGSGKSTLLKAVSGLYDFERGSITLDGLDLRQIDPSDLRHHIAYVPQHVHLFSGSLRDNVTFGKKSHTEQNVFDAMAFAGLSKFLNRHPLGLDMEISDGGEGLSMGQRQSIGLARLYLQDPAIVLLDEPTASLDQTLELHVTDRLRAWLDGKTCLLTTHRTGILSLAERIVVLKDGHIAMDGARDGVIQKLKTAPSQPSEKAHAPPSPPPPPNPAIEVA